MKKLSKLSLNELKENSEAILKKEEMISIKGGYTTCYDSRGNFGYQVSCYSNGTYQGQACMTSGTCNTGTGAEDRACLNAGYYGSKGVC